MSDRRNIIGFHGGGRHGRTRKIGMSATPRNRAPFRQVRRRGMRLNDPRFYLKAVIGAAALGLVVLPYGTDAVSMVAGARPESGGCRVVSVTDGDTVRMWCPGRGLQSARLIGFDTPEKFSPRCGSELLRAEAATWALRWMLLRADRISLVRRGTDHYGRALVFASVDDVPVARRMIEAGHARAYDGGARSGWCGT